MTPPNTIIADLVDDRNRMSAALHRIVFEAASYNECREIAKCALGVGALPNPPKNPPTDAFSLPKEAA